LSIRDIKPFLFPFFSIFILGGLYSGELLASGYPLYLSTPDLADKQWPAIKLSCWDVLRMKPPIFGKAYRRKLDLKGHENIAGRERTNEYALVRGLLTAISSDSSDSKAQRYFVSWLRDHGYPAHAEYVELGIRERFLIHFPENNAELLKVGEKMKKVATQFELPSSDDYMLTNNIWSKPYRAGVEMLFGLPNSLVVFQQRPYQLEGEQIRDVLRKYPSLSELAIVGPLTDSEVQTILDAVSPEKKWRSLRFELGHQLGRSDFANLRRLLEVYGSGVEEIHFRNTSLEATRYLIDGPWAKQVRILELNNINDPTKVVNCPSSENWTRRK